MNFEKDNRKFYRCEFQKNVRFIPVVRSLSGQDYMIEENSVDAWANDISEGGLRLETTYHLSLNSCLKLLFEMDEGGQLEIWGKVIWSHDNHCGIRFISFDIRLFDGIKGIKDRVTAETRPLRSSEEQETTFSTGVVETHWTGIWPRKFMS